MPPEGADEQSWEDPGDAYSKELSSRPLNEKCDELLEKFNRLYRRMIRNEELVGHYGLLKNLLFQMQPLKRLVNEAYQYSDCLGDMMLDALEHKLMEYKKIAREN